MNTYPCTCRNPKQPERTPKHEIIAQYGCHTVKYAKDDQQSTNNEMCNGEDSDPRHHHFEKKNHETSIYFNLRLGYAATCSDCHIAGSGKLSLS